ncbi:pyridoxal phosphate-dependent aminotransferase [Paracoccus sp. M683]|uniref:pyridoxal phosphate-dependent aminotransferase n=1 Tax=Paracoccus sp. M683 TaxID=2594268 RepID=UPI001C8F2D8E|nr:pyridoxal phosphate-dependent aminotransferase [Paracoccus sp. M683]
MIISLGAGEPDFDTPEHICDAAVRAIRDGHTRYTHVPGMQQLRLAVADKFRRENGLAVEAGDTINCTGGKQVIFNALAATLNEGDEVIMPAPYWVSYPEIVSLCGATPVVLPCDEAAGFKLMPDLLERAITPKTRWLILNSPSNPTCAVYARQDLDALAEVLRRHPRVLILSDDIYEHLIFDGLTFATLAQAAPDLAERTLTMNGVSKAYAMTGWRIGFGSRPKWLLAAMSKLQGQQTSAACSVSQHAAVPALQGPRDFIDRSRAVFERRRNLIVDRINAIPGLSCPRPEGAFYAFVNCAGLLGRTSGKGRGLETDEDVAGDRLKLKNPEAHVILDEVIAKSPLALAVRQNDSRWEGVVRWTFWALVDAEELGVTSENAADMAASSDNPKIRRLLGAETN